MKVWKGSRIQFIIDVNHYTDYLSSISTAVIHSLLQIIVNPESVTLKQWVGS
jgi:hypothetical protein